MTWDNSIDNLWFIFQVNYEFNVTTTSKSQYQATVTIGNTQYKETSTISAYQATSMAIYQALMKTEYAFHKIPDGLKNHRTESECYKYFSLIDFGCNTITDDACD